jgi:hypothetical protein
MRAVSTQYSRLDPRTITEMVMDAADVQHYEQLERYGIHLRGMNGKQVREMLQHAMDSNDVGLSPAPISGMTPPSIPGLWQFLQNFLPGLVRVITAVRNADEFVGLSTIGEWKDESVVLKILEPLGTAQPYTDGGNIALTSWNLNFEDRTIVRFEAGLQVAPLEEARSGSVQVASADEKRVQVGEALEIQRNRVAFYGYNDGSGRTFGFLNDPNLPAYVTAANGAAGSPLWSLKTTLEIIADLRQGMTALEVNSMGRIKSNRDPITIGLPNGYTNYLGTPTELGYSVNEYMQKNYANARFETAPELADANGGASALYFYAEAVMDSGTDDNRTFIQAVPTKMFTLGVEKKVKGYVEGYTNATAGVLLKRPYAVYRMTGI